MFLRCGASAICRSEVGLRRHLIGWRGWKSPASRFLPADMVARDARRASEAYGIGWTVHLRREMQALKTAWRNAKEFSGVGAGATCLWPRWLVLRAVGVVYVVVFAGIIDEGGALVGPRGIAPIAEFCATMAKLLPGALQRLFIVTTLYWFNAGQPCIAALEWTGMLAAVALVLNLWPRMALFVCWLVFLSFVSTWQIFTSAIVDPLMLEVALISIPFAPAGLRPGLGAGSPPRPIAIFAVRWLLFRLMLMSGLVKLTSHDPHWRHFTAMEVMYETSPLPTYLGYMAHLLPHALQVGEIALTFVAEIVAPLAALFGGRRGRWFAFAAWVTLQAGIELTSSFGWLNLASLAWGILLLDDRMLADAAGRLRLRWLFRPPAVKAGRASGVAVPVWTRYGLRFFLGLQISLTLYFSAIVFAGRGFGGAPGFLDYLFRDFYSANAYAPYGSFSPAKNEVEFMGSNDGGKTWRTYEFRFKPQHVDRMSGFVAPWFPRFEASLQYAVRLPKCPLIPRVAGLLIARNPQVLGLFKADPFPDRPATVVRMPVYRFSFTELGTHRLTGDYWKKDYLGDYLSPVYVNDEGKITE